MEPLKPEVMIRQVEGLAGDLRALTRPFDSTDSYCPHPVGMEGGEQSVPDGGRRFLPCLVCRRNGF